MVLTPSNTTNPLMSLDSIRRTPVSAVRVAYRGRFHRMLLKHESRNATGSVKDRTALGLLRALDARRSLRPGSVVVESTSGNLGIALAQLLGRLGCHLIAVVDPKTPDATLRRLNAAGARLHMVNEPDGHGGYLLNRLAAVAELCRKNPAYRWTNQYENPANPMVHQQTTGPEIVAQGGPDLDAVYAAVSTGGTLAGIAAHMRLLRLPIRLVAVDAATSVATSHNIGRDQSAAVEPGSRLVPGIGASRPSSFLKPSSYDRSMRVADTTTIAMCRIFRSDTGIGLGGSSGAVVSACVRELGEISPPRLSLCLAADSDDAYLSTIYEDGWLTRIGALDGVRSAVDQFRLDGVSFSLE
ncbi:pyridoxal-phosphate dependent enzyme [Streptomyces sp. NPDC059679]|uniref:pyridoxal-phosphate dependent enzyme n=1 Tax=Streptomyces sp. NPDC059679 TaxID=3346903 RepID=UPI0036BE5724